MEKNRNSSTAQQANRLAFKCASKFLSPLGGLIKMCYREFARKKKSFPMAMAMSQVLRHAVAGQYPDLYIDPEKVILSKGPVPQVLSPTLQNTVEQITIRYVGDSDFRTRFDDDEVIACAYQVDSGVAVLNTQPALRRDKLVTISIPTELRHKVLHVYLLICDRNRKKFSRSEYLGYV